MFGSWKEIGKEKKIIKENGFLVFDSYHENTK